MDLREISVIGLAGDEIISGKFPPSATLQELRDLVFEASKILQSTQRLLHDGSVLPQECTLEQASIEDGTQLTLVVTHSVVEYRVMQGVLYKKPGEDPETSKIAKLQRKVGSKLGTTGRTWFGPAGGEWAEVDTSYGVKPGWVLIEGPGFDQKGPLLQKVIPGEEEPFVFKLRFPTEEEGQFEACFKASSEIRHVKQWLCTIFPFLELDKIIVLKRTRHNRAARFTPTIDMLHNDVKLSETHFLGGDELPYVYLGDLHQD